MLTAAIIRLSHLSDRPMHADEAILAEKSGALLETGSYLYDPQDYHGPVLHYLTLIPAWCSGIHTYMEMTERTVRVVPAVSGILLVLMPLLLAKRIGRAPAAFAAVITAISPAMVYYSRYYIPEMLLVCFSFGVIGLGYYYAQTKKLRWAVAAGICAGLMCATKETAVLALGAMLLALAATRAVRAAGSLSPWHVLAGWAAAAITEALLVSSFFQNPAGILAAGRSFTTTYLAKAAHPSVHLHAWHYYLGLLAWFHQGSGPVWTEGAILLLAVVGGFRAITQGSGLMRFFAFYALILTTAYVWIPYKTPWCLLGFLHGMTLLAGVGAATLLSLSARLPWRLVAAALLIAAGIHLFLQAGLASYEYASDPRNPYVYAHTGKDVYTVQQKLETLARAHPEGRKMPIQIISRTNLWPLPWYLRRFSNVQWSAAIPDSLLPAPVILASPDMEPAIIRRLYEVPPPGGRELYMQMFDRYTELRPQVELRGYAAKTLWDRAQN